MVPSCCRLVTADGALAIKELIIRQGPADATADVAYREAVLATSLVPMPRPVRTSAELSSRPVGGQHTADLPAGCVSSIGRTADSRTGT